MLVAGIVGYRAHDYRQNDPAVSSTDDPWDLDYFTRPESFSEIEATRSDLEGLAVRYRTEARTRFLISPNQARPVLERQTTIIAELERGLEEFKDTPGESYLAQDLLLLLKRTGDYNRWLNVYLDLLYRRPTEEVIGLFAREARELGSATGRAAEVELALKHVLEIPLDFPAKRQLQVPVAHASSFSRRHPLAATL